MRYTPQDTVLTAVRNGYDTRAKIRERTGIPDRQVHGILTSLALADRVKLSGGRWSYIPECSWCKDTGLYDSCCRPHRCDCAAGREL